MQGRRTVLLLAILGVLGSLPGGVLAVDDGTSLDGTTDTLNDSVDGAVDDVTGQTESRTGAGIPSVDTTVGVALSPVTDATATCYDRYDGFFLEVFPPELDGYSSALAYSVCYAPGTARDEVANQCNILIWSTYGDGAQEEREMARDLMEAVCWEAIHEGNLDEGVGGVDACAATDTLTVSTTFNSPVSTDYLLGLLVTAQGTPCESVLAAGHDANARASATVEQVDSDTKRVTPQVSAQGDTAGTWIVEARSRVLSTSSFESGWSVVSGSGETLTCNFDVALTDTNGGSCTSVGSSVDVTESNYVVYRWQVDYTLVWVDGTGTAHHVLSGTDGGYL